MRAARPCVILVRARELDMAGTLTRQTFQDESQKEEIRRCQSAARCTPLTEEGRLRAVFLFGNSERAMLRLPRDLFCHCSVRRKNFQAVFGLFALRDYDTRVSDLR